MRWIIEKYFCILLVYYTFPQNIHTTFMFVASHDDVLVHLTLSGFPLDLLNKLLGIIYHTIPFSHTSYSRNVLLIYFVFWWHFSNNLVRVPRGGSFTWFHLEDCFTCESENDWSFCSSSSISDMWLAGIEHLEYCQVLYFIYISLYLPIGGNMVTNSNDCQMAH